MKALAICSIQTLPLLRRVIAPFNELTKRGHRFYYQEVTSFDPIISYGYDVTILHHWVFDEDMLATFLRVAKERTFVYDLANPRLLTIPEVQDTLRASAFVTVATPYLKKEVHLFNRRVKVLPSTLDFGYYMAGRNVTRAPVPTIGCFGPHDWGLPVIKAAITLFREKHPKAVFLGDHDAVRSLGEGLVTPVDVTMETYPSLLQTCWCGLCPYEGENGQDPVWALEYGLLCKPVVTTSPSVYTAVLPQRYHHSPTGQNLPQAQYVKSPKEATAWVEALEALLYNPSALVAMGNRAYASANAYRATKQAGDYLHVYEEMLPHLAIMG